MDALFIKDLIQHLQIEKNTFLRKVIFKFFL